MKKAFAVLLALGAIALVSALVVRRPSASGMARANTEAAPRCAAAIVSQRVPRAKETLIALFAVKPGETPPELPQLTLEERNLLPMIIENELTDADGCDAAAIRREFRLYMEFGGNHADFLPAYRRKLLKRMDANRLR